jgi:tetratricopeptide (TPR) repeat protein
MTFEMSRKTMQTQGILPASSSRMGAYGAIIALFAVGNLTFALRLAQGEERGPVAKAEAKVESNSSPGFLGRWVGTYVAAFERVQDKIDALKHLDEENRKLQLENAHLRFAVESKNFECNAEHAQEKTHEYEQKLGAETQSETGRTLASIVYQVPKNYPPKELYALGVSFFRSRDDEKAAVILSSLVGMDDDERYKTPPNLMMTGVAWYRVEHFTKAELYFDQVVKMTKGQPELASLNREALLWKGLVAEKTGQHEKSQGLLRNILDASPGSVEAAMVNRSNPRAQDAPHEKTQQ